MAYIDGAPASPEQLRTLALVNYGHFTSMRVDSNQVRGLSHHMERLARDCRHLFDAHLDTDRVRDLVRQAVISDGSESLVARVTVFDPTLDLGHPSSSGTASVLVTTRSAGPIYPAPLRVQSITYQRDLPYVKHIGLLGSMWHRRAAQLDHFDDALFVDAASFVSEGATWNIGFYDGDRIIWPHAHVLRGVTMTLLQQVCERSVTMPVNLRDAPQMHAAFATNTTIGVRPISQLDNVNLSADNEIFTLLRKAYEEIPPEQI